jgi:hypothetical protein
MVPVEADIPTKRTKLGTVVPMTIIEAVVTAATGLAPAVVTAAGTTERVAVTMVTRLRRATTPLL